MSALSNLRKDTVEIDGIKITTTQYAAWRHGLTQAGLLKFLAPMFEMLVDLDFAELEKLGEKDLDLSDPALKALMLKLRDVFLKLEPTAMMQMLLELLQGSYATVEDGTDSKGKPRLKKIDLQTEADMDRVFSGPGSMSRMIRAAWHAVKVNGFFGGGSSSAPTDETPADEPTGE